MDRFVAALFAMTAMSLRATISASSVPAMNSSDDATLGVILAGGLARRMGGGDKAFVVLDRKPLIAHALERLRPQCDALAINANGDPARFAPFGAPVVADNVAGFVGPLAGVLAGLDHARTQGFAYIATLAVDTPFAPRDLVARLHAARRAGQGEIAVAASGGRDHHVVALWPVSIADALRRALVEDGLRKAETFLARYKLARAEWPFDPFDPFLNVNTPEDLARTETILCGASELRG